MASKVDRTKYNRGPRKKAYNLKHRYGITLVNFHDKLKEQDNKCEICKAEFESETHAHVDHNHATGAVRGLLCKICNTFLGVIKEDADNVIAVKDSIKDYLVKYQACATTVSSPN